MIVGPNGSGKSNITDAVLWAMGEQSPVAVRGASMQDVIFAGAHGVQARSEAEVEVVLDNASGGLDLPVGEVAIMRKLNRAGEGEYRINGAKCRLTDVIEILSDTGLGKEMHSVVSQGRVEEIVTSKPSDRRMLIEEAAGLGKHRKRRRRAQLKLERTQDNLDRALDVEREARTRLKPLKRQAEAAELHERHRAPDGRGALDAGPRQRPRRPRGAGGGRGRPSPRRAPRPPRPRPSSPPSASAARRPRRRSSVALLRARGAVRRASTPPARRPSGSRCGSTPRSAPLAIWPTAIARRRSRSPRLEAEAEADTGDDGAAERIAALQAELAELAEDHRVRLERELAELEARREAATALVAERAARRRRRRRARARGRSRRRSRPQGPPRADKAAEKARRESARIGAELAKVNQFLRANAGAPGGAKRSPTPYGRPGLRARPLRRPRPPPARRRRRRPRRGRRAAGEGRQGRRRGADRPGDGARRADAACRGAPPTRLPPVAAAARAAARRASRRPRPRRSAAPEPIARRRAATSRAARRALLATLGRRGRRRARPAFTGIAVTKDGRVWSPRTRELRQVSPGGDDRVLAERNRRDALVKQVERPRRPSAGRARAVEQAQPKVAEADAARDAIDREARAAARARDEAAEAERHARWVIQQRRSAPDEGPSADRKAQVESAIAHRAPARGARRARARGAGAAARARAPPAARDAALKPRRRAPRHRAADGAGRDRDPRRGARGRARRRPGRRREAHRRAARVRGRGVARPRAAQAARRGGHPRRGPGAAPRDHAEDAEAELTRLATKLGLEPEPSEEPLPRRRARAPCTTRIERLKRRRDQLGPVNPLAQDEYKEALEHVEELERQREDLETALRELARLIRDTDRRIKEAFEETFAAAAKNFEEVVQHLFPGGRGALRLVREDAGPRPVLGGAEPEGPRRGGPRRRGERRATARSDEDRRRDRDHARGQVDQAPDAALRRREVDDRAGVPVRGLPRPAVPVLHPRRGRGRARRPQHRPLPRGPAPLLRPRAVHRRHPPEAHDGGRDSLYGVSMAGNGVSKVISRKLPRAVEPVEDAAA